MRTATDAQLESLALPCRSENNRCGERWKPWTAFFKRPVNYHTGKPGLSPSNTARQDPYVVLGGSARHETSRNWSGAYVTPHGGRRFVEIYGMWKVPRVKRPAIPRGAAGREYYSSIFIGLDGQRLYQDASLPQIGTRQDIDADGNEIYETWFEWFARGQLTWPTRLDVEVKPRHRVCCWLSVVDQQHVRAMIVNLTTGFGQVVFAEAPDNPPGSGLSRPRISGATAEWIVERPTSATGNIEVLANYRQVDFESCLAVAAGPSTSDWLHDLTGARLIRMVQLSEANRRSPLMSLPSLPDPASGPSSSTQRYGTSHPSLPDPTRLTVQYT